MISWSGNDKHKKYIPPGSEPQWILKNDFFSNIRKQLEIETRQGRLVIVAAIFTCSFFVLTLRLLDLMIINESSISSQKVESVNKFLKLSRSDIQDRNGWAIATTIPTIHLYANPSLITDSEVVVNSLKDIFPNLDEIRLNKRLNSNKKFVYLKRHVTPQEQIKINNLGIPGLDYEITEKRVYPYGNLFSHVIGTTDTDNKGTAGIEAYFDKKLTSGVTPLSLSLDLGVQDTVHEILSNAFKTYNTIGAVSIVLDVNTSEIISLVSLPDFDPSISIKPDDKRKFNRATFGRYEMGSTFKLFTIAMAMERNLISLETMLDARQPLNISGRKIDDFYPKRKWLSVSEVLMFSSNIGAVQIANMVGSDNQRMFLEKIGLLSALELEIPEIGRPDYPQRWSLSNAATISYGHGIAVTPLHVVSAVSSLVNGGYYIRPTFLKREYIPKDEFKRVMSSDSSIKMRYLMHLVVKSGSGKGANLPEYSVGGKTGSADKPEKGGYNKDKLITSFVGVFPIHNPRYVIFVLLDEPKPQDKKNNHRTSGWNAVPTAKEMISRIAPILGIYPDNNQSDNQELSEFIRAGLNRGIQLGATDAIE